MNKTNEVMQYWWEEVAISNRVKAYLRWYHLNLDTSDMEAATVKI